MNCGNSIVYYLFCVNRKAIFLFMRKRLHKQRLVKEKRTTLQVNGEHFIET